MSRIIINIPLFPDIQYTTFMLSTIIFYYHIFNVNNDTDTIFLLK